MKVFVYGSLKHGYLNHHCLERYNSEFLGKSILFGHRLYHVSSFPGMIKSPNPFEIVHGETYKINEDTLKLLDQLEGEGSLYKRELLTILTGIMPMKAYTYLYLPEIYEDVERVEKNNWQDDQTLILRYPKRKIRK